MIRPSESSLLDDIADIYEHPMCVIDGFDEAVIATTEDPEPVFVYDLRKIMDILTVHMGMSREEAQEYYDFNMSTAYPGEGIPIVVDTTYFNGEGL